MKGLAYLAGTVLVVVGVTVGAIAAVGELGRPSRICRPATAP